MLTGLGVSAYYLAVNQPGLRNFLGLGSDGLWFGIQPVSSGVLAWRQAWLLRLYQS